MKIALDTLGCKLNQAETEVLGREMARAGHQLVPCAEAADVYLLNTCTVTSVADGKSRHLLRQARRRSSRVLIVATGCYAQRAPEELARVEGIDLVVGNDRKPELPAMLEGLRHLIQQPLPGETTPQHPPESRTRSFVKIQDGCSSFCSYCIVPLVRGGEVSLPADSLSAEVRHRVADGYREVVLTGTRVGSYHHNGAGLGDLLRRLLAETGVPRLRLSSLQPGEITPDLLQLWRDVRLCPHFHLALQSGSDAVLGRMKRRYSAGDFRQAASLIRHHVPEVAITTDVIVGFPGETDEEHEQSYRFCEEAGFARIHVFPYSARSGTEAALMPEQVDSRVRRERARQMLSLARKSEQRFRRGFSGRTMTVLWEQRSADGRWSGITGNYIRVHTESREDLFNKLMPATLP